MPVFFNDWRAQRGSQWNTRQREKRQFAVPSSVANGGFAPLGGAAATPVAALKTPVASGKEGLGVAKREEGAMRGAQ